MQKLILPFLRQQIICGYMTEQYKKSWGYDHYGIDLSSRQGYSADRIAKNDHTIFASGDGEVVICEYDQAKKSLGYAIAIVYKDCIARDGSMLDLVARYMHCDTTFVKKGDKVVKGQPISVENKIGTNDYHLHLEFDTDLKYPRYSPQVASGHTGWLHGTDTTVNPSLWLWQDNEHVLDPYGFSNRDWINKCDTDIPIIVSQDQWELEQEIDRLRKENASLSNQIGILEGKLNSLIKALENILKDY